MSSVDHPLFGTLNLAQAGEWDATLDFQGNEVDVELTLDEPDVPVASLEKRLALLDKLTLLDKVARAGMLEEAADGEESATGLYMAHHLEELPKEAWSQVFGKGAGPKREPEEFLSGLELVRIGLYPGDAERCVLLDYALRAEVTNYLLCAAFDENAQLVSLDMES